jgi:hypothetical protein
VKPHDSMAPRVYVGSLSGRSLQKFLLCVAQAAADAALSRLPDPAVNFASDWGRSRCTAGLGRLMATSSGPKGHPINPCSGTGSLLLKHEAVGRVRRTFATAFFARARGSRSEARK